MCFSATASFVAGASLSAIGVATLKKTKNRAEVPFAAIPLMFGVQQLIEGFVWLSFKYGNVISNPTFSLMFYFFSNVWWPLFVPLAVLLIEPVQSRRRILWVFEIAGIAASVHYFNFMMVNTINSEVVSNCIVYAQPHHFDLFSILYVIVTCVTCFVSSKKVVKILGVMVSLSLIAASVLYSWALVSVWCFFAAVLSFVVYFYFKRSGGLAWLYK